MREYKKKENAARMGVYAGAAGTTDMVEAAYRIIQGELAYTLPKKKEKKGKMRFFLLGFATAGALSFAMWLVFAL